LIAEFLKILLVRLRRRIPIARAARQFRSNYDAGAVSSRKEAVAMPLPAHLSSRAIALIIIGIQTAALVIGVGTGLTLSYDFNARWYFAVLDAVVAYMAAMVLISVVVGFVSRQQDAS
jgi:hypothetical protein